MNAEWEKNNCGTHLIFSRTIASHYAMKETFCGSTMFVSHNTLKWKENERKEGQ